MKPWLALALVLALPAPGRAQTYDGPPGLAPLPLPAADAPARCGAITDGALGPSQPILGGRWRGRLPAGMGPRPGTTPDLGAPWPGLWLVRGGTELWLHVVEEGIRPDRGFERLVRERLAVLQPGAGPTLGVMALASGRALVVLPTEPDRLNTLYAPIAWGYLFSADGLAQSFDVRVTAAAVAADREGCRALALRALATLEDGGSSPIVRGSVALAIENGDVHVVLPPGEHVLGESEAPPIGRTVFARRVAPRSWGVRRGPAVAISRALPGRWSPSPDERRRSGTLAGQPVEWIEEVLDFDGGVSDARARATVVLGTIAYDVVVAGGSPRERAAMQRAMAAARFEPSE